MKQGLIVLGTIQWEYKMRDNQWLTRERQENNEIFSVSMPGIIIGSATAVKLLQVS